MEEAGGQFSVVKKCSYCGRENNDDAVSCRECGTEFEPPAEQQLSEKPELVETSSSRHLDKVLGVTNCVASLEVGMARELLARLEKEEVPVIVQTVTQEGGLEYSNLMVADGYFERACDIAEAWQAEQTAEAEKRSNRYCPKCGSRHLEYIGTETFGSIWKCKDCGNDFAK